LLSLSPTEVNKYYVFFFLSSATASFQSLHFDNCFAISFFSLAVNLGGYGFSHFAATA